MTRQEICISQQFPLADKVWFLSIAQIFPCPQCIIFQPGICTNIVADVQTDRVTAHSQRSPIPQDNIYNAGDVQFSDGLFDFMDPNFDLEGIDSYLAGNLNISAHTAFTGIWNG